MYINPKSPSYSYWYFFLDLNLYILFFSLILLFSFGFIVNSLFKKINFLNIYLNINIFFFIFLLLEKIFIFSENENINIFFEICILLFFVLFLILLLSVIKKLKINEIEFLGLMTLGICSILFLFSSENVISFTLSLEIVSFIAYVLCSMKIKNRLGVEASLKYYLIGGVSSCFIFFGFFLLCLEVGSIDFSVISDYYKSIIYFYNSDSLFFNNMGSSIGFVLILFGFFFKLGVVPFHLWVLDVYEGISLIIISFFSTILKLCFSFIFIILLFKLNLFLFLKFKYIKIILLICCIFSLLIGSFGGLIQTSINKIIAYSSISNIAYFLIFLIEVNHLTLVNMVFYILIYVINLFSIFFNLFNLPIKKLNNQYIFPKSIYDLSNIYQNNQILSFFLAFNFFSLLGLPPLSGFVIKYYAISFLISINYFLVALIFVSLSIVGAFYYIKIIKIIFFSKNNKSEIIYEKKINFLQSFVIFFIFLFNILFIFINGNIYELLIQIQMDHEDLISEFLFTIDMALYFAFEFNLNDIDEVYSALAEASELLRGKDSDYILNNIKRLHSDFQTHDLDALYERITKFYAEEGVNRIDILHKIERIHYSLFGFPESIYTTLPYEIEEDIPSYSYSDDLYFFYG